MQSNLRVPLSRLPPCPFLLIKSRFDALNWIGFGKTGVKSGLGATSWKLALDDISFFVNSEHINSTLPIFLIGHSMGGGLSIAFATREVDQPGLSKLKGIISSSPLILVKSPPPAFIGGLSPSSFFQFELTMIPTVVLLTDDNLLRKVKLASIIGTIAPRFQMKQAVVPEAISRDPVVNAAYAIDPLCAPIGTYKGISNMLIGGEQLLKSDFARFPAGLPLLVTHGSGDLVRFA